MDLYRKLINLKKQGEILDWDKISYDELYQLWGPESVSDRMIADLYDISEAGNKARYSAVF